MSRLYLVRHGIAADATAGQRDFDRALTDKGDSRMREVVQGMARAGLVPEVVVSSPLVRAVQTAEILVEELELTTDILICDAMSPGGRTEELLDLLNHAAPEQDVAAVGHMPDLVHHLLNVIGGGAGLDVAFKKGGVAAVDFDGPIRQRGGLLHALLTPAVLRGVC